LTADSPRSRASIFDESPDDDPIGSAAAPTLGATVRMVASAAAIGSAVIHFALAPAHLDEQTSHGVFFLAIAWAQLAVVVAIARWGQVGAPVARGRWNDRVEPWLAAAALNAGIVAVWLGSRTIGVPKTHHDSIGFTDTLSAALEIAVVLAAVVALRGSLVTRRLPSAVMNPVALGVAGIALVGVVSASVSPSLAGETAAHSHGHDTTESAGGGHHHAGSVAESAGGGHHHGDGAAVEQVAAKDRCDLGFNTAAFNAEAVPGVPHAHDDSQPVDFTLGEWADVFVDPGLGLPREAVLGYLEANPAQAGGILSGGLTHTLDPDPWNGLTDAAECDALADELMRAKQVAVDHPTVADAKADGYLKVTPYFPGIAAHYIKPGLVDDEFEVEAPEMLLYDGTDPGSHIVGLSDLINQDGDEEPTAGFTGNNDHYHVHNGLCFSNGVVVAGSNTTDEECAGLGGSKADGGSGWMSHAWVVPGCESDWGVFSGANPALPVLGLGTSGWDEPGCGTGLTPDDPLAFETGNNGPEELAVD
jgi:hypothetical protein